MERKYISMLSKKDLAKLPRNKALSKVGIKEGQLMIQAPKCKKCGGACMVVDLGDVFLQCPDCGYMQEGFVIDDLNFRSRP